MKKIIEILKTDEKFPELKDIKVGETIDVLLTEDRFNELYNEIKWIKKVINETHL